MFRNVALLLLTGCNVVFGLEEQEATPGVCGPYLQPTEVAFTDVTGATDFSVDATGTHALVKASYKGANPRYLAVVATGADTFAYDPVFDKGLPALQQVALPIYAAHINGTPNHLIADGSVDPAALADMFVAARTTSGNLGAYHYTLRAASGWTPAEPAVDAPADQDVIPFDDLEEMSGVATLFARRLVVVRVDPNSAARTLDLDIRNPGDPNWRAQTAGGNLPIAAAINAQHSVEQAVLALGTDGDQSPLVLLYSAAPATAPSQPPTLYLSRGATTGFPLGESVSVGMVTGEMREPWTTPTCKQLWFRSGSTIYHAQSL